jgi:hypothetical protein
MRRLKWARWQLRRQQVRIRQVSEKRDIGMGHDRQERNAAAQ